MDQDQNQQNVPSQPNFQVGAAPVYSQNNNQTQQVPPPVRGPATQPPTPADGSQGVVAQEIKNTNPNSTQNSLEIAEIRDGVVIMKDGSYRAVVLAQSINFDLMSPQEREGVESSYQGFLNSLYFDIQITMRSRRVDLRNYMNKLQARREEQSNILLGLLMDDYMGYIDYLAQNSNIMDKQFFVTVPYEPISIKNIAAKAGMFTSLFNRKAVQITINEEEFVKAKTELKNRVQAVLESMNQMGVQAIPLDTQELIELYYDVYNPDTATSQPLINYSELEGAMVTKGDGDSTRSDLKVET